MTHTKLGGLGVRIVGGNDREGGGPGPVVVLLHGFGAPGDDLVPLARVVMSPPGARFVFPEAPLRLDGDSGGGRAWWRVDLDARMRRRAAGEVHDVDAVPEGLDEARAKVDALLDEVWVKLKPADGHVVLGGFSQGAMLALDVALHSSRPLAGIILLSGTHVANREWAPRFGGRRDVPVFMSHGQTDEILPFAVSAGLRDALLRSGMKVDWVPFRGGHAILPNVIDAMGAFLCRVLG